mgnify:CR=1 FL=1
MAEGGRGLSIGYYALIMVALVLLAFLSYGAFTYSEFQRIRADLEVTSLAAAEEEVKAAMDQLLQEAEDQADTFARWEEVGQQLRNPRYYAYWRNQRMMHANVLPDFAADAKIYDVDARALAILDRHADELACVLLDLMPPRVGLKPADAEFVAALRDWTRKDGSLLLLDKMLRLFDFVAVEGGPVAITVSWEAEDGRREVPAERLLSAEPESAGTITDVMYRVGFSSKSSFNTQFKQKTGLTPSEYRRKVRSDGR